MQTKTLNRSNVAIETAVLGGMFERFLCYSQPMTEQIFQGVFCECCCFSAEFLTQHSLSLDERCYREEEKFSRKVSDETELWRRADVTENIRKMISLGGSAKETH